MPMQQGGPPTFPGKRDLEVIREDVLCAYLVLRELNEYGQHYNAKARVEIVEKALTALRNVWVDTGAAIDSIEPKMLEMLRAGVICRGRPKKAAVG
jgi:hypothetical protein